MPYWRLSSFYLCYFAALGALVPFWGLYLQQLGFAPAAIGGLTAVLMGTKVIAPMAWGWLADRDGRRMSWVRRAAALTAATFVGLFWAKSFAAIALTTLIFGFFWNASLPQMEAVTFNHLGRQTRRYSSIRVWGSVGFALAVAAVGGALASTGVGIIPYVVSILFLGVWVAALSVPDPGRAACATANESPTLGQLLARPEIGYFLLTCFLMQFSHGVYYSFYSIHLEAAGYRGGAVGALWAFAVVVEVLVFMRMHWLLERCGARRVLLASLALAVLRWLITGPWPAWLALQIVAQALHAATFGAFHASAIHLVHHYFPGPIQGRGQALYNSLGFGAGGAAGSLGAGFAWSALGPTGSFLLAALAALLGWLLAYRHVDRARRF